MGILGQVVEMVHGIKGNALDGRSLLGQGADQNLQRN